MNDIKYHPNGRIKHKIRFYVNGCKWFEQYYDQNGKNHRKANLPDYHSWHQNGITYHITYRAHGNYHNISNPADIWFFQNGKIESKFYYPNGNKLDWNNKIKNL